MFVGTNQQLQALILLSYIIILYYVLKTDNPANQTAHTNNDPSRRR